MMLQAMVRALVMVPNWDIKRQPFSSSGGNCIRHYEGSWLMSGAAPWSARGSNWRLVLNLPLSFCFALQLFVRSNLHRDAGAICVVVAFCKVRHPHCQGSHAFVASLYGRLWQIHNLSAQMVDLVISCEKFGTWTHKDMKGNPLTEAVNPVLWVLILHYVVGIIACH